LVGFEELYRLTNSYTSEAVNPKESACGESKMLSSRRLFTPENMSALENLFIPVTNAYRTVSSFLRQAKTEDMHVFT